MVSGSVQFTGRKVDAGVFAQESEVRSYCRTFTGTYVSASGSHLIADDGRRYIDFLAGCSALNYGHNDPDMVASLMEYLSVNGVMLGLDLQTDAKARFIDLFSRLILRPRGLDYKLQFTGPTGTNAVEAALKLARKHTGRSQVISFTRGFHGVSLGALAATANRHHRMTEVVQLPNVVRACYDGYLGPDADTADYLEKLLDDPSSGVDQPAAILLETVQGEGGLNACSEGWLKKIAQIARRHKALLIIDDIQAGCGRTGSFFSFESMGIKPDIVTLAKSISGIGLPMSLVLIKPELDRWLPGEHNGTFRGNSLAFVSAGTAIEKYWYDDELMQDTRRRGVSIQRVLEKLASLNPAYHVKGRGMFLGLDVGDGEIAASISEDCYRNGLIIETAGPHGEVLKVLAPLTTADHVLTEGLSILEAAVRVKNTAVAV